MESLFDYLCFYPEEYEYNENDKIYIHDEWTHGNFNFIEEEDRNMNDQDDINSQVSFMIENDVIFLGKEIPKVSGVFDCIFEFRALNFIRYITSQYYFINSNYLFILMLKHIKTKRKIDPERQRKFFMFIIGQSNLTSENINKIIRTNSYIIDHFIDYVFECGSTFYTERIFTENPLFNIRLAKKMESITYLINHTRVLIEKSPNMMFFYAIYTKSYNLIHYILDRVTISIDSKYDYLMACIFSDDNIIIRNTLLPTTKERAEKAYIIALSLNKYDIARSIKLKYLF